jgi:hypothetical protein
LRPFDKTNLDVKFAIITGVYDEALSKYKLCAENPFLLAA